MKYNIEEYCEHFRKLLEAQLLRCEKMEKEKGRCDFEKKEKIIIGVIGGDGIGPIITREATRVLEKLLADEIATGSIVIKYIEDFPEEDKWIPEHVSSLTYWIRKSLNGENVWEHWLP